ncbi:insulinase family protein [Megasphaera sueciensis]|uniref:insulinase family protein n=1 Tax=Megasphaera sueciensis TaxID=349094 RepID=UPI003D06C5E1
MKLEVHSVCNGFHVDRSMYVKEINSQAYSLTHIKSGARVLYLANDDDNKVFSISFRTPPTDSTGVPHICEHSVLCGSRKFPLKEPFVELVKGSLNTFLNAMTFPDKTMYPVASRNAADFKNLMDVYLDAVFFPNMLTDEEVLMQEGWHYDMDAADAPLTYRGVVYNEMKGAFSSPDALMERHVMENLFPQTAYGVESGGDPDDIPHLTQEAFVAFHAKFYHPANSYIFLYGDMDIEKTLEFIDGEYLNKFDCITVDSEIHRQAPVASMVKSYPYGIASDDNEESKTLHTLTYVIDDALDPTLGLAFKVLTYVLLQSPAAPLKKALLDAGVGKDVSGDFQDGILQPVWSVSVNGSEKEAQEKIIPVVQNVLTDMIKTGIDKTLLTGALNRTEFALREADFAGRPKGLIYGIRCMDTWLYGGDPLDTLAYEHDLQVLRQGIETGYYERLMEKYILKNPYHVLITMVPEKGFTERHDQEIADSLEAYKATLPKSEIDHIVAKSQALKQRQATPDSAEALLSIPTLQRSDLESKAEDVVFHVEDMNDVPVCYVPDFTNGIAYINAYFDLYGFSRKELSYIYLLSDLIGDLDTTSHSYGDLASQIDLYTGGMDYSVSAYSDIQNNEAYTPVFQIKTKVLSQNISKLLDLMKEISLGTTFTNAQRLRELIEETKSGWDMDAFRRGHIIVMHRVLSYLSAVEGFCDAGEFSYYEFITAVAKQAGQDITKIADGLSHVMKKIFTQSRMTLEITGSEEDKKIVKKLLPEWLAQMPLGEKNTALCDFSHNKKNEGIMTSGKVQYVAKGGNFRQHGFSYTGSLQVLETILQYGYLWTKIRVQGGAYGAFAKFYTNGDMVLCSYRDPNLKNSIQVYDELAEYLSAFDVSEREMTKYVIGTLSRIDIPFTPSLRGAKAMNRYFTGNTQEMVQQRRDELLATTVSDIRALAPLVKAAMTDNCLCVMGSETAIRQDKELFGELISLPD